MTKSIQTRRKKDVTAKRINKKRLLQKSINIFYTSKSCEYITELVLINKTRLQTKFSRCENAENSRTQEIKNIALQTLHIHILIFNRNITNNGNRDTHNGSSSCPGYAYNSRSQVKLFCSTRRTSAWCCAGAPGTTRVRLVLRVCAWCCAGLAHLYIT